MTPTRAGPAGRGQAKRAEQIASAIEADVLADRWPIGARIGAESELAQAYGVSRWTMREAVAILEQAGTVVARRGTGGGLFAAAPALDLVRNGIGAYLESAGIPFADIAAVRLALVAAAAPMAIERMTRAERATLAGLVLRAEKPGVDAIEAMALARTLLRDATGNRTLALFIAVLADVGMHSCWMSALDDEAFVAMIDGLAQAARRHCLAMLAEDVDAAMDAEAAAMEISGRIYAASSASGQSPSAPNAFERAYTLYPTSRPAKKAERVAWAIRQRINDERLAPGANLGSEAALMARYGVGRPVLREAIRTIERLGLVKMRRGAISGLVVAAPDPARVIALARDYLRRDPPARDERAQVRGVLRAVTPQNPVTALMLAILAD